MANNRISRDLDDRLQGRVEESKERQALAASSPEEAMGQQCAAGRFRGNNPWNAPLLVINNEPV